MAFSGVCVCSTGISGLSLPFRYVVISTAGAGCGAKDEDFRKSQKADFNGQEAKVKGQKEKKR
jgi:hypothetical protein